jgi:hypothetical protein
MNHVTKANLGLTKLSASDKVVKAQSIKDSMLASGKFAAGSMPITYPVLQTLITNLHNAVVTANTGTTADTSFMHEQERLLVSAFNFIKAHIEFIANAATDPSTIIIAAGLQVIPYGGANGVTELTLETAGNGVVQVRMPRLVGEKAFVIETSTDNLTWAETTMSSLTKLKISNLIPATTLYVRYYAISKIGKGATSQVKTIIVV